MSKESADRRDERRGLVRLGCIAAVSLLCACDARPTGEEDVIAISRHRPTPPNLGIPKPSSSLELADDGYFTLVSRAGGPAATGGGGKGSDQQSSGAAGGPAPAGSIASEPALPPAVGEDETLRKPVLFWVDVVGSRVYRANADGTGRQVLASAQTSAPDGVTVDLAEGFVYWTNMGTLVGGQNIGTLQRMKLGGETIETVVPVGTTNTPKQISIDTTARKLYWCDREGAKVWRSAMDGKDLEVLVSGHGLIELVGMGLDVPKRQFYFSDRAGKKIYRANFDFPEGENAENRTDVETLFSFAGFSMPLDVDLDLEARKIYWSDRYRGTISRANMDMPAGAKPESRNDIETLLDGLMEPIGVSLDRVAKKLYFTRLAGEVSRIALDEPRPRVELVVSTGSASGVTLAHLPADLPLK